VELSVIGDPEALLAFVSFIAGRQRTHKVWQWFCRVNGQPQTVNLDKWEDLNGVAYQRHNGVSLIMSKVFCMDLHHDGAGM
jgi:hypothetical protein